MYRGLTWSLKKTVKNFNVDTFLLNRENLRLDLIHPFPCEILTSYFGYYFVVFVSTIEQDHVKHNSTRITGRRGHRKGNDPINLGYTEWNENGHYGVHGKNNGRSICDD